jgi:hypothetical protein
VIKLQASVTANDAATRGMIFIWDFLQCIHHIAVADRSHVSNVMDMEIDIIQQHPYWIGDAKFKI